MKMASVAPVSSLYVHVPFCARKCAYCAFYSEPTDGPLLQRYLDALLVELTRVAAQLKPRTIFFGGGTPSLLTVAQWKSIGQSMERLGLLGAAEWTIECNPATVSMDKARLWRSLGVNRVSMGVQSLNPTLLERLGRIHSREAVFKSFDLLRQAGFDNLNVDLMFAIPGQTLEIWQATLDEALALGSEHLSSYEVIYEEDTPLYEQLQAGQFSVDEDLACAMYDTLVDRAGAAGFEQYEIANFARSTRTISRQLPVATAASSVAGESLSGLPAVCATTVLESTHRIPSQACLHNVNYWRGGSYFGLGPSAAGFVNGLRTKNVSNTVRYCELLEQGRSPQEWQEPLPPLARAGEIAAFGLRMNTGWGFAEFQHATGFDLREHWQADMASLVSKGWACLSADRFYLNRAGLRFADAAAEAFLK